MLRAHIQRLGRRITTGIFEPAAVSLDNNDEASDTGAEFPLDDDQRSSVSSFGSERSAAQVGPFSELLASMIRVDRVRKSAEARLKQSHTTLQALKLREMELRAELKHNAYRQRRAMQRGHGRRSADEDEEMASALRHLLATCTESQAKIMQEVVQLDSRLRQAVTDLNHGEPRLFRAARGYIRNIRSADPDETIMPRTDARALRLAADCWRTYHDMARQRRAHDHSLEPDLESEAYGPQWDERGRLGENWRAHASRCYAQTQSTLIKYKLIEPEEAEVPDASEGVGRSNANGAPANDTESKLLQDLVLARGELLRAQEWLLQSLPTRNDKDRELYLRTYEEDYYSESDSEDNENIDGYTQEYMGRVRAATDRVRNAEKAWRDLRQRAVNEKVHDPAELDLFGVQDHPDDGFTESCGSRMAKEIAINRAGQEPTIHKWLTSAYGNGYSDPSEPSVVADTRARVLPSVRSVGSEGDGTKRHGLIARWNAELLDVRESSERLLAESRREDAAKAAAWRKCMNS